MRRPGQTTRALTSLPAALRDDSPERALAGAAVQSPKALELADELGVEPERFLSVAASLVLEACRKLYGAGAEVDGLAVFEALAAEGKGEHVGGFTGVYSMWNGCPLGHEVRPVALDVRGRQLYRRARLASFALEHHEPGAAEELAQAAGALAVFQRQGSPGEGYRLPGPLDAPELVHPAEIVAIPTKHTREHLGETAVAGAPGWLTFDGGLYHRSHSGGTVQYLDWLPICLELYCRRDEEGRPAPCSMLVSVKGREAVVSLEDLRTGEAWDLFREAPRRPEREVLTLLLLSRARAELGELARPGWHELGGRLDYYAPDGRNLTGGPGVLAGVLGPRCGPPAPSGAEETRRALAVAATIGPALLTLGAGARSLGWSLAPTASSLILVGPPHVGKTASAHVGRMLAFSDRWPAAPTGHFSDTTAALERALALEADLPTFVDELSAGGRLDTGEARAAVRRLEGLVVPIGNLAPEVRGRMGRDGSRRPGNRVRSLPVFAGESLPQIRPAARRRCVIVEVAPGDVDLATLRAEGRQMIAPMRAIGEAVVALLGNGGVELLEELDGANRGRVEELLGLDTYSLAERAAPILTGLELVERAAGVEGLRDAGLTYLEGHLRAQAAALEGDLAGPPMIVEALGQVVVTALLERRAHIANRSTGLPEPILEELTAGAQGLEELGGRWAGRGVSIFPVEAGLAVRSLELQSLAERAREPLLVGLGSREFVRVLGRAGALVPSRLAGGGFSHKLRLGAGRMAPSDRYVVIARSLIVGEFYDDLATTDPKSYPHAPRAPRDSTESPRAAAPSPGPEQTRGARGARGACFRVTREETRVRALPSLLEAAYVKARPRLDPDEAEAYLERLEGDAAAMRAAIAGERPPTGRRAPREGAGGRAAALPPRAPMRPYRALVCGSRAVIGSDGVIHLPPDPDAGHIAEAALELTGGEAAVVLVHGGAHHELGLPRLWAPADPTLERAELLEAHPLAGRARARGVEVVLASRSSGALAVRLGNVRVELDFPAWTGDFDGCATPAELLEAAEAFREALGITWATSGAATIHHLIRRSQGRLRLEGSEPEPVLEPEWRDARHFHPDGIWRRELTAEELERAFVVAFDRSGSYVSVLERLPLGLGPWTSSGPSELPRRDRPPGYWLVELEELRGRLAGPDPFTRRGIGRNGLVTAGGIAGSHEAGRDGPVWLTTPLAQRAGEIAHSHGMQVTALASHVQHRHGSHLRNTATAIRAARETLRGGGEAGEEALRALKRGYAAGVAWLEHGARVGDELGRPYWRRAIIDRFVCNLERSLAGVEPAPFLWADVDTVFFALDDPELAPAGLELGTGFGQWKPKGRPIEMAEAKAATFEPRALVLALRDEP